MRARWIVGLLGVAAGATTLFLLNRGEGDILTREALQAARERWKKGAVADYTLEVTVEGKQSGDHRIEVRRGKVVEMTTGGAAAPEHVWKYWSVEGMFRFLETELGNAERPKAAYGVDEGSEIVLRVVFDDDLGYPRRFLRHVMGRQAGIEWKVAALTRRP